jgi:hypothetical protein
MEGESVSIMVMRSIPRPSPPGGRHAELEGADVVLVHLVSFVVALLALGELLAEAPSLFVGIVELRERIRHLHPADVELEPLDPARIVGALLGEGRDLDRESR